MTDDSERCPLPAPEPGLPTCDTCGFALTEPGAIRLWRGSKLWLRIDPPTAIAHGLSAWAWEAGGFFVEHVCINCFQGRSAEPPEGALLQSSDDADTTLVAEALHACQSELQEVRDWCVEHGGPSVGTLYGRVTATVARLLDATQKTTTMAAAKAAAQATAWCERHGVAVEPSRPLLGALDKVLSRQTEKLQSEAAQLRREVAEVRAFCIARLGAAKEPARSLRSMVAESCAPLLAPLPMVIVCPACGGQHIDRPTDDWSNPPHRSHLCEHCGLIWRVSDRPTTGVAKAQTRGSKDSWPEEAQPKPLFEYTSYADWKSDGGDRYRSAGMTAGNTIAVDTRGRAVHSGEGFRRAQQEDAYPVSVYSLAALLPSRADEVARVSLSLPPNQARSRPGKDPGRSL